MLYRCCERQQSDVARLLDRVAQAALVRRADARNAPRNDLAALGNETREQPHVLIVDVVDSFDAKPANLLAPEILFLLSGDGFITAGGPLPRAAGSSFGFRHIDSPGYSAAPSLIICCATDGWAGAGAGAAAALR